ncbi:hypothetical protein [Arthrobacter sp. AZCC_0090]|uniref:hypothetical protein n=1 Tax=Arthrobacter sp. AZCC_0090 TaxID=2735881 RepID=UPI00161A09BC|nr:hypothetical protein [Arthrobacter sp. AZCC_0090]MBB6402899.1 hypothetical protein [Arthrobacter sp. AZCC_0090]
MVVKLNKKAFEHAKSLIRDGKLVIDTRDDWSEHAPSTQDENKFLDKNGDTEYSRWFLGMDDEHSEGQKGRYKFPYGDFKRIHRCAVISAESRASQYDYDDIRQALGELLDRLDAH